MLAINKISLTFCLHICERSKSIGIGRRRNDQINFISNTLRMDIDKCINISKHYLKSLHIHYSDEWVEGCINWYHEESEETITQENLKQVVFEQWLNLNLRDAEVGVLPANINNNYKQILNGVYHLQVMYVEDISRPKLWQLEKIQQLHVLTSGDEINSNNNYNNPNNANRTLLLHCTDGLQNVTAMEYEKIPTLHLNMTPGIKIRINGPVTIRKGMILLKKCNITVLGGEVEELLITNAAENIILRSLGKPVNPNPLKIDEFDKNVNNEKIILQKHCTTNNVTQSNNLISHEQNLVVSNLKKQNTNITQPTNSINNKPQAIAEQDTINEYLADFEMDWDKEFTESVPQKQKTPKQKTPNQLKPNKFQVMSPEDLFDDDFEYNDTDLMMIENEVKSLTNNVPKSAKKQLKMDSFAPSTKSLNKELSVNQIVNNKGVDDEPLEAMDDDFFNEDELDKHLNKLEQNFEFSFISNIGDSTIVTIEEALKKQLQCFKIKAKFKEVAEKLKINEQGGITIKIVLYDGTKSLTVKLENECIEKMIDFSKKSLLEMKPKILQKDVLAQSNLVKILIRLREKLKNIDGIVTIECINNEFYVKNIL